MVKNEAAPPVPHKLYVVQGTILMYFTKLLYEHSFRSWQIRVEFNKIFRLLIIKFNKYTFSKQGDETYRQKDWRCICLPRANIDLSFHIPVDGIWMKDLCFYEVVTEVRYFHGRTVTEELTFFRLVKMLLVFDETQKLTTCTVFYAANCACNR